MLGDSIEKITKLTGIKSLVEKATSGKCGCAGRKKTLNNPDLKINKLLYKKR
jgi:hypothetical protein